VLLAGCWLLSCHRFQANQVRLWLGVIAYNLGNLWRRLALPAQVANWSLTSLQQRLVKTGGRLIKHARYYWLLLAESHLTRAALRQHAQGRDAAVASGIGGLQSAADFGEEMGWGKLSAESIGQTAFLGGLHGGETLNRRIPARLAAPWTKTGPKP